MIQRTAFLGLVLLAWPVAVLRAEGLPAEALIDKVAPAIVTVHGVLKVRWSADGKSQERETAIDGRGAMVDPGGIVMLRNTLLGADSAEMKVWKRDHPESGYAAAPTNLVVFFGNDPTEHPAALLAQDSRLDLAFLLVLDLAEKQVPSIDLGKGVVPKIGLDLLGVTRAGRGFDLAPEVQSLYVSSRVEKPRAMWGIRGDFSDAGLPVFDVHGTPAGVLAYLQAAEGASQDEEDPDQSYFLLPLDAATKSLDSARKRVAEVRAQAAAAEKPATPEAPKKPEAPEQPEQPKEEPK